MSGEERDICARECIPSVDDPAETVDKNVNCFNDVTEGFSVGSS
jgi:hypothetical protein